MHSKERRAEGLSEAMVSLLDGSGSGSRSAPCRKFWESRDVGTLSLRTIYFLSWCENRPLFCPMMHSLRKKRSKVIGWSSYCNLMRTKAFIRSQDFKFSPDSRRKYKTALPFSLNECLFSLSFCKELQKNLILTRRPDFIKISINFTQTQWREIAQMWKWF